MNPGDVDRLRAALADRYHIDREIGHGGMATVYLANDIRHERQVAIKVVYPEIAHAVGGQRFLREIAIAARLQHPNILTLIDSGEAGGFLFYVMPFVEGETLRSRIARNGALSESEAVRLFREIIDALAYAHKQGMVHRDIKPDNVMLTNRHALILDFGVAKAMDDSANQGKLTTAGASLGTPAYMAPEQVTADPSADHRADIYSAGVVAYEMLAGEPPFKGSGQQVMSAHVVTGARPISEVNPSVTPSVERIVMRCLEKDPGARYQSAEDLLGELESLITPLAPVAASPGKYSLFRNRAVVASVASLALIAVAVGVYALTADIRRERWVRNEAIPAIQRYVDAGVNDSALLVAKQASKIAPDDSLLNSLWNKFSRAGIIRTEPAGAKVFTALFNDTTRWEYLGITPTDSVRISRGPPSRIRIEKDGFETVNRFVPSIGSQVTLNRLIQLDSSTSLTRTSVRIPGGEFVGALPGLDNLPAIAMGDYRIDKHEVTNREFKKFVDAGGYNKSEYWEFPFIRNGRTIPFAQAVALFRDRTGRPGPATWEVGDAPQGQEDLPVGGLSWYEASAFARFSGKMLPTVYHWARAATVSLTAFIVPTSNFNGQGLTRGSSNGAMSGFGVFDMAGNVREWCYNASGTNRYILGGGWNDQPYMSIDSYTQDPFDRSAINGVRLMDTLGAEPNLRTARAPLVRGYRDYDAEKPVSDAAFKSLVAIFDYDRLPLDSKVEQRQSEEIYVREKITFAAAYEKERVIAYLFLPKRGTPPYQTIVYFPGSNAIHTQKAEGNLEIDRVDFLLKSGRAVMYPVYKSTYERGDSLKSDYGDTTIFYRNHVVMWANDLRRSVDYLATRKDIQMNRLGYFGVSWGGTLGAIMVPLEPRIKAAVLYVAGMPMEHSRPEADQINFLPRIKIPVIMLNGKYDHFFPVETSQRPFFRLIGTPAENKKYILYDGGHFVPRTQLITESLNWLDRYLGPVK